MHEKERDKYYERQKILRLLLIFCNKSEISLNQEYEKKKLIHSEIEFEEKINTLENEELHELALIKESIELANNELFLLIKSKTQEIEEKLEYFNIKIKENSDYYDNLLTIQSSFSKISTRNINISFAESITTLKSLLTIDSKINELEKYLINPNEDIYNQLKLNELSQILSNLQKKSITSLKIISTNLEKNESDALSNVILSIKDKLNINTYNSVLESLIKELNSLTELENMKINIINESNLKKNIINLDKNLSNYFSKSEKIKEKALTGYKILGNNQEDLNLFVHEALNLTDIENCSIILTLDALLQKTERFIEISSSQDKILLESFEKMNLIEGILDEIDIKLDEYIFLDIKDISKSINPSDLENKIIIEDVKKNFSGLKEVISSNMHEHSKNILKLIENCLIIDEIRRKIRENQAKDLIKIKLDFQEKINTLSSAFSTLENEKKSLEQSFNLLKTDNENISKIAEKNAKICVDKELEITSYKRT